MKIAKIALIIASLAFVAGCAKQQAPAPATDPVTVSVPAPAKNVAKHKKAKKHHSAKKVAYLSQHKASSSTN